MSLLKLSFRYFPASLISLVLIGCASFQPDTRLPVQVVASPNHDVRRPTMVVIHYTTNDEARQSLETLTSPVRKVSAHYLIDQQGRLYQLVPENQRAWHAGQSYWAGITDINSASIGIEIDNNGKQPFEDVQILTLLSLLADIQTRHKIRPVNIVGHADVAPGRKVDPGPFFPWRRLAQSGFGLWCDPDKNNPVIEDGSYADLGTLLIALGYDPRLPDSSRIVFREHYLAREDGTTVEDETLERAMAQCLWEQKNGVKFSVLNPQGAPDEEDSGLLQSKK